MRCYDVVGYVLEEESFCADCAYGKAKKHGRAVLRDIPSVANLKALRPPLKTLESFICVRCKSAFGKAVVGNETVH